MLELYMEEQRRGDDAILSYLGKGLAAKTQRPYGS
jgi:hypothetical protein